MQLLALARHEQERGISHGRRWTCSCLRAFVSQHGAMIELGATILVHGLVVRVRFTKSAGSFVHKTLLGFARTCIGFSL
jgi:hypothetical protein